MTLETNKPQDSTQETWSRPDGDRFLRSPISTDGQVVVVSQLYMADPAFVRMLNKAGDLDTMYGLVCIMYFVYDPDAPMYKHLNRSARMEKVMESHVPKASKTKVKKLLDSDDFEAFKTDYLKLVCSPAQLMLRRFTDEVHSFIDTVNGSNSKGGQELRDNIKHGKQLLIDLEDLSAFVLKEGKSKTRGDYKPALFERRDPIEN